MEDPETPQYQAVAWLANEDPAMLDLDRTAPEIIQERYLAAFLYFNFQGDQWIGQFNFLSGDSICDWNLPDTVITEGIVCNDDNRVISVAMGK